MPIDAIPTYLFKITNRANILSDRLLHHPLLLYHYQIYRVPYKLSKLVVITSKAYQATDYIEAMATAAILDYQTQYFKSWLNRKRDFYGHISPSSNY